MVIFYVLLGIITILCLSQAVVRRGREKIEQKIASGDIERKLSKEEGLLIEELQRYDRMISEAEIYKKENAGMYDSEDSIREVDCVMYELDLGTSVLEYYPYKNYVGKELTSGVNTNIETESSFIPLNDGVFINRDVVKSISKKTIQVRVKDSYSTVFSLEKYHYTDWGYEERRTVRDLNKIGISNIHYINQLISKKVEYYKVKGYYERKIKSEVLDGHVIL